MDDEVARLIREERLLEAASLSETRGDPRTASDIYERACAWGPAARTAMLAGDPGRALELAIESGDEHLAAQALDRVPGKPLLLEALAWRLSARGHEGWAARLFEAAGKSMDASLAWERSGEPVRAAELRERGGDPVGAARALEAALRRHPQDWGVAVALGGLLLRYERIDAAVRVLQRVPPAARERSRALSLLSPALRRLGLNGALDEVAAEAAARGWSLAPEPLPGPARAPEARLFGRYRVAGEVASSPMARVLECFDVVRGERVAVKIFAGWDARGSGRDAVAWFNREVRAMRALEHPNIVPLLEFIVEAPAIVLAWMKGGTLEKLLAGPAPIAPSRAVEIALAILSALGEAHRLGILHRDVKPANVLFDGAGGARLSDFGVAHLADVSTTATAGAFGTLAYMSPEQQEGRPATARSDLFAVGIMLREMLTREQDAPGSPRTTTPSQTHRALDERHDQVIASMTALDPAKRPADAFAAREALSALAWPSMADAPRLATEERPSGWHRGARLEERADGPYVDVWTGQSIEQAPLHEGTLSRARAFANADHPAVQTVLRVDRGGGSIWLEAFAGPLSERSLTDEERDTLRSGLAALHNAGAVHGSVDRAHIGVKGDGGLVLRFQSEVRVGATIDEDRLALESLLGQRSATIG